MRLAVMALVIVVACALAFVGGVRHGRAERTRVAAWIECHGLVGGYQLAGPCAKRADGSWVLPLGEGR